MSSVIATSVNLKNLCRVSETIASEITIEYLSIRCNNYVQKKHQENCYNYALVGPGRTHIRKVLQKN
jgi:hypothetical protein